MDDQENFKKPNSEVRVRKKNGEYLWISWRFQSIPDGGMYFGVGRDINEAKMEANRSREFLHSILENIPNMVFVKDADDLRFKLFNRAGEELLGYKREDLIGKNDFDFFPKEQAEFFINKDKDVLRGRNAVVIDEEEILTSSGNKTLRTKKIPVFDRFGKAEFLVGISEDITELKKNELEKQEFIAEKVRSFERESAHVRSLYLADANAIMMSSLDYKITLQKLCEFVVPVLGDWCTITMIHEDLSLERVAAAHQDVTKAHLLKELLEYPHQFLNPRSGTDSIASIDESRMIHDPTEAHLATLALSVRHLEILKELGCTSSMIVPIGYRGKVYAAMEILISGQARKHDVQDLLVAEELARKAGVAIENALLYQTAQKAIAVRNEFLSIASHELKTPITALKLQMQMTRLTVNSEENRMPSPEKLIKTLDSANEQINRLTSLIEDLLDVSRIEAGRLNYNFQKISLSQITAEMVDLYTEHLKTHGCIIDFKTHEDIYIQGDKGRIEQVILNLLSNAAKYGDSSPVEIELSMEEAFAKLEVTDHGLGIPKELLDNVFDRFVRAVSSTNISGLGLGLYISKEIIRAHNGTLTVRSELGKGSTFTLKLPAVNTHHR